MKLHYSKLGFNKTEVDEENFVIKATFSTGDVDRHGEIVDQKSWMLKSYMENPVVLFGHDHNQPPVGRVLSLQYNKNGDLEGELQFAAKQYPFAEVLWKLYRDGFMKAFSVGFASGKVDNEKGQIILRENELFEISTVSVPANAMALAKSKGLNVEPLEEHFIALAKAKLAETTMQHETDCETKDAIAKDCPCRNKPAQSEAPKEEPVEEAMAEEKAISEKGPLGDEVAAVESMKDKTDWLKDVYEIFDAFYRVVYQEDTSVDQLPSLVSEMSDLLKEVAGEGVDVKKAKIKESINAIDKEEVLSKLKSLFEENEVVEGEAEEKQEEKKLDTEEFSKVKTPVMPLKSLKKLPKASKNRAINKAIRKMLKEKNK